MKMIAVRVPDVVLARYGGSSEETTRATQSLLALKFFELGHVSCGDAAAMCEMNVVDFLLFAEKAGVPASVLYGMEQGRTRRVQTPPTPPEVVPSLAPAAGGTRSGPTVAL